MAPSDSIRAPTRIVVCVLYSFVCSTLDLDLIERSKPAFLENGIVLTPTLRRRRAQEEPLLAERESERQARRYQAWSAALVVAEWFSITTDLGVI